MEHKEHQKGESERNGIPQEDGELWGENAITNIKAE